MKKQAKLQAIFEFYGSDRKTKTRTAKRVAKELSGRRTGPENILWSPGYVLSVLNNNHILSVPMGKAIDKLYLDIQGKTPPHKKRLAVTFGSEEEKTLVLENTTPQERAANLIYTAMYNRSKGKRTG